MNNLEHYNTMGWTFDTIKEHFELKFKAMDKALKLARKLMDSRLEGMNEFRAQLNEQVKTFVSVEKYEGAQKNLNQKIDSLSKLVYIGLGVWIVLQVVLSFILIYIFK